MVTRYVGPMHGPFNQHEAPCGPGWTLVYAEVAGGWDVFMRHEMSGLRVPEGPNVIRHWERVRAEGARMCSVHNPPPDPDQTRTVKCWACCHAVRTMRNGIALDWHSPAGWPAFGACPGSNTEAR